MTRATEINNNIETHNNPPNYDQNNQCEPHPQQVYTIFTLDKPNYYQNSTLIKDSELPKYEDLNEKFNFKKSNSQQITIS